MTTRTRQELEAMLHEVDDTSSAEVVQQLIDLKALTWRLAHNLVYWCCSNPEGPHDEKCTGSDEDIIAEATEAAR